jgi:hypothetical protein
MRLLPMLLMLAAIAPAPATAQPFTGSVTLNGRGIPLPPGEWRVLGKFEEAAFGQALGVSALLLVQDAGDRLAGMVVARASTRATNAVFSNWSRRGACAAGDETIAVILREASERRQDCARVTQWSTPTVRPPNPAPEFQKYFELAETQDGWAPSRFQSVWIAFADNTGDLEVYYHFSPETRGFVRDARPVAQNAWTPANQNQRQKEYLARLVTWGRAAHAAVRVGFLDAASAPPLPPF